MKRGDNSPSYWKLQFSMAISVIFSEKKRQQTQYTWVLVSSPGHSKMGLLVFSLCFTTLARPCWKLQSVDGMLDHSRLWFLFGWVIWLMLQTHLETIVCECLWSITCYPKMCGYVMLYHWVVFDLALFKVAFYSWGRTQPIQVDHGLYLKKNIIYYSIYIYIHICYIIVRNYICIHISLYTYVYMCIYINLYIYIYTYV